MLKKSSGYLHLNSFANKCILIFLLIGISFLNMAQCQKKDTTILYFKQTASIIPINNIPGMPGAFRVSNADSADFIRVLLPEDSEKKIIPVRQYYKNGKINFIGSFDLVTYKKSNIYVFIGDFLSFYPNGKRERSVSYKNGHKDGLEYLFYQNGRVNYSIKYEKERASRWEFFDSNGSQICEKGNGRWIVYDQGNKPILQGVVKNGVYDGEWNGQTFESDSIKYVYVYKNGEFIKGTGYDKHNKAYPFKNYVDESSIKKDPFKFMDRLRTHFKIPKEIKKNALDSVYVSFILEKDGSFSQPLIDGNNDPALKAAFENALNKCTGETPKKYYGVPLRSKITFSLNDKAETRHSRYTSYGLPTIENFENIDTPTVRERDYTTRRLSLKEEIIGFD